MSTNLGLPQREVDALARIIRYAARNRTTAVDLRVIFGEPPPGQGPPWTYELAEEGLRRYMAARPDFADDCQLLLRIHAENRGMRLAEPESPV